jgi:hypothetical protein
MAKIWRADPKPITSSDPTGWQDGNFGFRSVRHDEEAEEGSSDVNKGIRPGAPKEAGTNTPRRDYTNG